AGVHRARERADVDVGAVAAVDAEVVDDDDLALGERADERQPVLGIRRAVAGADAVRLRIAADRDVGARRHAHDLLEQAVGVDQLPARRAGDPEPDGEVIGQGVDDVLVGGYCRYYRQPADVTRPRALLPAPQLGVRVGVGGITDRNFLGRVEQ